MSCYNGYLSHQKVLLRRVEDGEESCDPLTLGVERWRSWWLWCPSAEDGLRVGCDAEQWQNHRMV